jgi:hypothetical protein
MPLAAVAVGGVGLGNEVSDDVVCHELLQRRVVERQWRQVLSLTPSCPPLSLGGIHGARAREIVRVFDYPHERWCLAWALPFSWPHGSIHQGSRLRPTLKDADNEYKEPRVMVISPQGRKPHLPVETRLM